MRQTRNFIVRYPNLITSGCFCGCSLLIGQLRPFKSGVIIPRAKHPLNDQPLTKEVSPNTHKHDTQIDDLNRFPREYRRRKQLRRQLDS